MSNGKEEKKGTPGWAKAVAVIGVAAGAAVGIYEVAKAIGSALAAGPQAAVDQLTKWSADYAAELHQICYVDKRLPTAAEEYAMKKKQDQINDAYNKLFIIWGYAKDAIIVLGVTAIAGYFVTKYALNWLNSRRSQMQSGYSFAYTLRCAQAIDLYGSGNVSLAVALQTQTETVFTSIYSPAIQTSIVSLQTQLATFTETQLLLAQTLIQSLQIDLASNISNIVAAANILLSLPPPPF